MGLFNIFTTGLAGSKEQSSNGEQRRLSAEYVPAVIAEMQEARRAVENTLAANQRHPNTHPHLVTQTNLDKIAEPALQGAFTNEAQQIQRANAQLERTLEMMGLTGKPQIESQQSTTGGNVAQQDEQLQTTAAQDLIADAQARVAASYASGQPSTLSQKESDEQQSGQKMERRDV